MRALRSIRGTVVVPEFVFAFIALAFFLCGCARPVDPLNRTVVTANSIGFEAWRDDELRDLPDDLKPDFNLALQELRFQMMGNGTSGTEDVDASVRRVLHGQTTREAIQRGYEARITRLTRQLAQLQSFMSRNARLTTRPGDFASEDYLAQVRDRQSSERESLDREIDSARKRLAALGGDSSFKPKIQPFGVEAAEPKVDSGPDSMPVLLHR